MIFIRASRRLEKKGQEVPNLNKSIHSFIRVFCENHFADSDYTILQKELRSNYTTDWLGRLSIDVILKLITYIIWTDKSMNGYFVKRIEDNTMLKLLTRLENVVYSYNMKKQDTPSSDFGSTPFAVSA